MRVLLIDVNCKHSSTGKIVYDLYQDLSKQGHVASVAFGRGVVISEPHIVKYGIDLETMFHALMTRLTGLTGYFSPLSTYRLLRHMRSFKPDVVHLHDLHGYHVNIGRVVRYLKATNIKTIWTFHSEFMYTGKCGHAKTCTNFMTECHHCPLLHDYPKSLYFDFTRFMFRQKKKWFEGLQNNLTIVTPSKWLTGRVQQSFLRNFTIKIIPNGIDANVFGYKQANENLRLNPILRDKRLFLSVIAKPDDSNKGFQWILKYADELKETDVAFVVVGKNYPKQLPHNIYVVDYLTNPQSLAALYHECDAYLMVSEYENYPTVCLEASAASMPILGFNSGGVQETSINVPSQLVEYGSTQLLEMIRSFVPESRQPNNQLVRLDRQNMREQYYEIYNN
jgi:putative colanic acid biosynthesis glycosyltransferase